MKNFLRQFLSQERIAGGAFALALTQLIASFCGFLRDRAFSSVFPLDRDPVGIASVYIAAFRPSDLLFQIFVMSALSVVVVPFLAGHLAHGRRKEMDQVLTGTMFVFGSFFGIAAIVLAIFFPEVAPYFTKFEGESLRLYIQIGRIALLTNFLFVFGSALGQYLITFQRYWIYGITPIIWSLGTILGTYLLTPYFGMMGPIYGTLIGTIFYCLLRFAAVVKQGFIPRFKRGEILGKDFSAMGWLIVPRMAALGALQLQLLLLDRLASGLGKEYVALNQFASNFESVIPGIVGIAIAQSAFSLMSQSAALKSIDRLKENIWKSILFNLSLAIPGAIALGVLSGVAASLMKLSPAVSPIFISSLLIYCIAVPFESTNHIILRSFYALKNTGWPALSSAVSCFVAVVVGTLLIDSIGVCALAVAYVTAQICQTLFLSSMLTMRLRRIHEKT